MTCVPPWSARWFRNKGAPFDESVSSAALAADMSLFHHGRCAHVASRHFCAVIAVPKIAAVSGHNHPVRGPHQEAVYRRER